MTHAERGFYVVECLMHLICQGLTARTMTNMLVVRARKLHSAARISPQNDRRYVSCRIYLHTYFDNSNTVSI